MNVVLGGMKSIWILLYISIRVLGWPDGWFDLLSKPDVSLLSRPKSISKVLCGLDSRGMDFSVFPWVDTPFLLTKPSVTQADCIQPAMFPVTLSFILLCFWLFLHQVFGLPQWLCGKESSCRAGAAEDSSSTLGSGRSPGEGHGNPLQYSCLENPMDEEPGGLQSIGSQRVGHNWNDLAGRTHT